MLVLMNKKPKFVQTVSPIQGVVGVGVGVSGKILRAIRVILPSFSASCALQWQHRVFGELPPGSFSLGLRVCQPISSRPRCSQVHLKEREENPKVGFC